MFFANRRLNAAPASSKLFGATHAKQQMSRKLRGTTHRDADSAPRPRNRETDESHQCPRKTRPSGRAPLVTQLRAHGHNDIADKAEQELPPRVRPEEHQELFDRLGVPDDTLVKVPGA